MAQFKHTTTYNLSCPTCAGSHIVKMGIRNGQQRYLCRSWRKAFRASGKAKGRRMDAELMGSAIRDYYSGKSYKQIAEGLADEYDIPEPSKATIFEWVRDYTDRANREMEGRKVKTSGHWVADEMYVKVGGKTAYNWNGHGLRDPLYLGESPISNPRWTGGKGSHSQGYGSGGRPAQDYQDRQVAGLHQTHQRNRTGGPTCPVAGIVRRGSTTIGRSGCRGRTGTGRRPCAGWTASRAGQRYLDGWTLQYNLFRGHHSLGDRTPAEAAKVDAPFTEWADVVKADTMARVTVVSDVQSERVRPDLLDVPRAPTPTPKVDLDLTDLEASQPEPSRRLKFDAYAPARSPQRVGRERLDRGQGRGLTESRYRVGRRRRQR